MAHLQQTLACDLTISLCKRQRRQPLGVGGQRVGATAQQQR